MRLQTSPKQPRRAKRKQQKRGSQTSLEAWSFRLPAREVNLYANRHVRVANRFQKNNQKKKKLERVKCVSQLKDKKHRSLGSFRDQSLGSQGKKKSSKTRNLDVNPRKKSLRRRVLHMKYESFNLKGRDCLNKGKENKKFANRREIRPYETMKEPFWGGESYAAQIKAKAEALKRKVFMKCVRSQERKSPNQKSKGYLRMFLPRKKRMRVDISKKNHKVVIPDQKKKVEMICSNQFTPVRSSGVAEQNFEAESKICRKKLELKNSTSKQEALGKMKKFGNEKNPRLEAFKKLFRSKSASEIENCNAKSKKTGLRNKLKRNVRCSKRGTFSHFENKRNSLLKDMSIRSWSRKLKEKSREILQRKNQNWKGSLKKRLLSRRFGGKNQPRIASSSQNKISSKNGLKGSVGWKGRSINVLNNNVNNTTYLKCSINIFDNSRSNLARRKDCNFQGSGSVNNIQQLPQNKQKEDLKSQFKDKQALENLMKKDLKNLEKFGKKQNFEDKKIEEKNQPKNQNNSNKGQEIHTEKWVIPRPPCAEKWLLAVEDLISELSPERESSSREDIGTVLKTSKESPIPGDESYPIKDKILWTEKTSKKDKNATRKSPKSSLKRKSIRNKTPGTMNINRKGLEIRVPSSISGKERQVEISLPESPNIKIMLPQSLTRELLESLRISCTTPKNASPSLEKYLNSISKCIKEMNFITKVEHLESEGKESEIPVTPKNLKKIDDSGLYSRVPRRSFKKKGKPRGKIKSRKGNIIGLNKAINQNDLGQFIELMTKTNQIASIENMGTPKAKKTASEKIRNKIAINEKTQKKKTNESPVSESESANLDFLKIDQAQIKSFGGSSSGSYPETSGQCTISAKSSNWKNSPGAKSKSKISSKWEADSRKKLESRSESGKLSNWTNQRTNTTSKPSSTWTESKKSSNWKESDSSLYQFKSLNHRTITEESTLGSKNDSRSFKIISKQNEYEYGIKDIKSKMDLNKPSYGSTEDVMISQNSKINEISDELFEDIDPDKKMILSKDNTNRSNKLNTEMKKVLEIELKRSNEENNFEKRESNNENIFSKKFYSQKEETNFEEQNFDPEKSQNSFSDIYVGVSQDFESENNFELKEVLLSEQKSNLNEQHSFSVSNLKVIKSRQIFGSRAKSPQINKKTSRPNSKDNKIRQKTQQNQHFEDIPSQELNRILISSFKTKGENIDSKEIDVGIDGLLKGIDIMKDDILDPLKCSEELKRSERKEDSRDGSRALVDIEKQETQISNLETGTFRNKSINPFLKNKNLNTNEKNIFYEEVQDHIGKIEILDICEPDSPRTLNIRKNLKKKRRNFRHKNAKNHFSETNNSLTSNSMRSPKKGINILAHLRRIKASVLEKGNPRSSVKKAAKNEKDVSIYDRLRILNLGSHRNLEDSQKKSWNQQKGRLRIKPRDTQSKKSDHTAAKSKDKKLYDGIPFKNGSKKKVKSGLNKFPKHKYSLSNNFIPTNNRAFKIQNSKSRKTSGSRPKKGNINFLSRQKHSQSNMKRKMGPSGLITFPKTNNLTFCENELLYSPEMSFGSKQRFCSPDSLYLQNSSSRNLQMHSQNQIPTGEKRKNMQKKPKYGSFCDFGKNLRNRGKIGVKNLFSKKFSVRQMRSPNLMKK